MPVLGILTAAVRSCSASLRRAEKRWAGLVIAFRKFQMVLVRMRTQLRLTRWGVDYSDVGT